MEELKNKINTLYDGLKELLNELYQKNEFNELTKKENTIDIEYIIKELQPVLRSAIQSKMIIDKEVLNNEKK